ncbi:hypothetical protein AGABI1DRAFT_85155 [Agaricus bisporus var. burnettii JB137-S8]|uniref:Uncharacterized protein n=1 Tax=Agaricus bisporus var. burnettii (strain JB137-S8 / ATCC MYA-4627 / FGSC 10392) TaxID=597362 RepID=K5XVU5_AGABU|nr:hypothetical protein AGABI2DRAFT_137256 [Agaricus bisporus var. bisporus H97]XP_007330007.1 uncharacterized protein AGABI1DRAFT_85155 [Agaricus bisporus var. burnettii JB137-S8]EKM79305.1 hypothetical protein AGABI1DRAFT_85155 [Agaricus bisporus var. burnettii JB137-S8]EKV45780.1 hypothetical protein AGABI2DRAFT_137256 [Agaricus bisporus var. bisporus H97]
MAAIAMRQLSSVMEWFFAPGQFNRVHTNLGSNFPLPAIWTRVPFYRRLNRLRTPET